MSIKVEDYLGFVKKLVFNGGMCPYYEVKEMDVVMSYSFSTNTLKMNIFLIEHVLSNKPYPALTDEQMLSVMTYHEMGHMKDIRKNPMLLEEAIKLMKLNDKDIYNKFMIQRELSAWELGKQFVPIEIMEEYDDFNKQSLEVYKKNKR